MATGELDRFVTELRGVAREEARRAAPKFHHYQVVELKPIVLEAFGSDLRLIDGDDDIDFAYGIRVRVKVGDSVKVLTDEHGDHHVVSLVAPTPTSKTEGGEEKHGGEKVEMLVEGVEEEGEGSEEEKEEASGKVDVTKMKGCVIHGADATVARPEGFPSVEWIGSVAPNNAIDNDTWANPGTP